MKTPLITLCIFIFIQIFSFCNNFDDTETSSIYNQIYFSNRYTLVDSGKVIDDDYGNILTIYKDSSQKKIFPNDSVYFIFHDGLANDSIKILTIWDTSSSSILEFEGTLSDMKNYGCFQYISINEWDLKYIDVFLNGNKIRRFYSSDMIFCSIQIDRELSSLVIEQSNRFPADSLFLSNFSPYQDKSKIGYLKEYIDTSKHIRVYEYSKYHIYNPGENPYSEARLGIMRYPRYRFYGLRKSDTCSIFIEGIFANNNVIVELNDAVLFEGILNSDGYIPYDKYIETILDKSNDYYLKISVDNTLHTRCILDTELNFIQFSLSNHNKTIKIEQTNVRPRYL